MSVYIVKDGDISLTFDPNAFLNHIEIPVTADFGLLEDKALEQSCGPIPKKNRKLTWPTMGTFDLHFEKLTASSILKVTAMGGPLPKFIGKHKQKNFRMNFNGTFEDGGDGFTISCEMIPGNSYGSKSLMFRGEADIDMKIIFKANQTCTGRYSLEFVNKDAFEYGHFSECEPMIKRFLEEGKYTDFEIISEDGTRIPCHIVFLAGRSPVLDRMLQTECKETRDKCVKMEASVDGVKAFLKYMYYGDLGDAFASPNIAIELLDLGHVYDVKPLEDAMKILLKNKAEEWLDIDAALNLYLCTVRKDGFDELKEKALKIIKSKKDELNESSVFQHYIQGNSDQVTEFFKLLL